MGFTERGALTMKLKAFFNESIYFCLFDSVHPQTIHFHG